MRWPQLMIAALGAAVVAMPVAALDDIERRSIERRATEVAVWAMPAVNADLMYQAFLKAGGGPNRIAIWSGLMSWKNQTLTPNPDTIYAMPFFNTRDVGPVVLEIPPADTGSITGNIDNIWQAALEDAGPSGADKGKGGKYLVLPPGYAKPVTRGYIPLRSDTYSGYALIRSTPKSGSAEDVEKAVAYAKRVRLYPFAEAKKPPRTIFVDVIDTVFDATIPYDIAYFQSLDRVVQAEPWLSRDRAIIDSVRSLGIAKGKPFQPDADTAAALAHGAEEARAWLEYRRQSTFSAYFEGKHWVVPAAPEVIKGQSNNFTEPDVYPVDARAVSYSMGYVGIKRFGAGQFYLMAMRDKAGKPFDGAANYRLVVPANAPAGQYWSATVYDAETHAFIRDVERFSRASHTPGLRPESDGSVVLHFGPSAPAGADTNWVPTKTGRRFEVLFRLYDPQKPLFDKSWVLPDVEVVQ